MTTLVYSKEKHALYADSRETDGSGRILSNNVPKIKILDNGDIIAMSGSVITVQEIERAWPDINFEKVDGTAQGFYYDVGTDEVHVIGIHEDLQAGTIHPSSWRQEYTIAFGSGADFALAGMDLGLGPAEAIEYAATRDSCTNDKVTMIDLRLHREGLTLETY